MQSGKTSLYAHFDGLDYLKIYLIFIRVPSKRCPYFMPEPPTDESSESTEVSES